tara:strand:- start:1211 stop:1864 length:654 start_codon:yes stop_codon:yes gene_type:complete
MTLNISTPFAYYLGHGIIDEIDFTDIRNDERIVWTIKQKKNWILKKNVDTLGLEKFHEKYYRILESYPDLRDNLTDKFNLFLKNTYGNITAKITSSWLTCLEDEGDYIETHRHANCFYSGILYFDEVYDKETVHLELRNPLGTTIETMVPPWYREDTHCKSLDHITLIPDKGAYFFFPAICYHGTELHKGKRRKSLAFNFVIDRQVWCHDSSYNPKW